MSGSAISTPTYQAVANNIKGSTTGVAPAAGYLGELALDVANSGGTSTYGGADFTISTGNLTVGTYIILCDVSGYNSARPSSGIGSPRVAMSVNSVEKLKQDFISTWAAAATANDSDGWVSTLTGVATVPSGATHAVTVTLSAIANSGTPTDYSCGVRANGRLRAVRIA